MDIKDLNKPQLILLAVLLSFITSIATGITTVTLMQQAPASFTVPVNRVIQQTVEKIQQVEGKTITQTVVVKEEDLVVDAIAKNKSAVFSLTKEAQDPDGKDIEASVGRGFAVSTDGMIVADTMSVFSEGIYFAQNDSGKFKAKFVKADNAGFSFLKLGDPVNGTDKLILSVPASGDLDKMKIGQKVIVFGGGISSFIFEGNKDIKISVAKQDAGGLLLDLDGNALGIVLSGEAANFAPIKSIGDALVALKASAKAE
ncbi:MAG: hypothetical protein UW07_C0034G0008 [Candidatus Nomurabacteria bacterium GW2011_GWF2_43_8]|uniref:Uncharacterized protein n=3 Tax=Candidatus Nomuraibacteriota TaxID=1752729 RepID=A0A0G1FKL9_9BACT|nr:MAG: hypothetical protein UV76_C0015G0017 [Candidatus Nomurabacteria bacterium GW2011_GWA2_43_15]KKT19351.1 MAG: hypothetical protein UW02_C0011G0002 [Candidatus Nomurabacteria bacterium GW2011_GWB1_43_7]KKT22538.1 MAG: hypothetical protein UW07_C0034G0008 [Candidatus Nomurabacteria bacterium GW2011_GWF2_43_8]